MIQIDLSGQVAVVTGGSSGIGYATARLFLQAGASVAICGRDGERLEAAQAALAKEFPQAQLLASRCDVLDESQVNAFASRSRGALRPRRHAGEQRGTRPRLHLRRHDRRRLARRTGAEVLQHHPPDARLSADAERSARARDRLREFAARVAARAAHGRDFVGASRRAEPREIARDGTRAATHPREFDSDRHRRIGAVEAPLSGLSPTSAEPRQSWEQWTAELARKKNIPLGRFGLPEEAAQALFYLATTLSSYTTGSHIDVSGGFARHV